jgi:O-methyltransferase involved in polyketide biosynthesis
MQQESKDYSTISPSAKSLLLMKGYTGIPYAKETAALMQGTEVFDLDFDNKDFWFWIRVMHFESRYKSIDQLLELTGNKNILELSSGYSLRGVDLCEKDKDIHYIDTDLPEVIATKKKMIAQLQLDKNLNGQLELMPLNAMDAEAFANVVNSFKAGPLTIVNEGLLMYLGMEEKKQLCRTIHSTLEQRGGCWITADIYMQRSEDMRAELPQSKGETSFFEQHQIEENKFKSYEAAQAFFDEQGFRLVKEAVPDYQSLSVMPQLMASLPPEIRNSNEPPPRIQCTWMLEAK